MQGNPGAAAQQQSPNKPMPINIERLESPANKEPVMSQPANVTEAGARASAQKKSRDSTP